MALRGFGVQTFSGSAQPAFGTTLAAAATPTPDAHLGNTGAGANPSYTVVTVTNAIFWKAGERIGIGTAAQFGFNPSAATGQPDWGRIAAVDYTANTLTVQGLQRAHASGEFAVLGTDCAIVSIEFVNGGGPNYVGGDSSVGVASTTLAYEFIAAQITTNPYLFQIGSSSVGNVHETSSWWVNGTGSFVPSIVQI